MVLKLLEAIEGRWRAVNGPYLVTLVPVGARFQKAGWSSDPGRSQSRRSTRSPVDHAGTGPTGLTISHRAGL